MPNAAKSVSDNPLFELLIPLLKPILTGLGVAAAAAAGSLWTTGDWKACFRAVPLWGWILILAIFIMLLVDAGIRRHVKYLREASSPLPMADVTPRGGWAYIDDLAHAGVLWKVKVARLAPFDPLWLEVDTPPRCPRCRTEIEQTEPRWVAYRWGCPSPTCGFRKANKRSYRREAAAVRKIAKRRVECRLEEHQSPDSPDAPDAGE